MINPDLIQQISKRIVDNYQPDVIYLFGSATNSDLFNPAESDIDLLIIKENSLPPYKRYGQVRPYLRGFQLPFDLIIMTPQEAFSLKDTPYSIVNTAYQTGIKLYEK